MTKRIAIVAILVVLVGCSDTKPLPGGYELERWEDGVTFYITGPGDSNQDGGGAIEGTVQRIAWNSRFIFAKRYSNFRGDPDGWMRIDSESKKVSGPISDEEFEDLVKSQNLKVKTAQEAWSAF